MFQWYRLFNLNEFNALGLVSVEISAVLGALGLKKILITKGNFVSILVDDAFLSINMNSKNPMRFGERAVFLDANSDVWVGVYDAN